MLSADEPRFFFVHVMKTAGTTLSRGLREHFPPETVYPARGIDWTAFGDTDVYTSVRRLLSIEPERRDAIRVFTGHFPFMACGLLDPALTTLTILREPVARSVAALRHFKRDPRYAALSLREIYDNRAIFRFYVENHQTKVFSLAPADHEDSIACGCDIDEQRFVRACENLASVDAVGLTEEYGAFVAELRERFGWWPGGVDTGARANVSVEGWDADDELCARIAADNAFDVRFYEYARDLVAQRRR